MEIKWDCYRLCLNTPAQIREIAYQIGVSSPKLFLFWNRMHCYNSYDTMSTIFGISKGTLNAWFNEVMNALIVWAENI